MVKKVNINGKKNRSVAPGNSGLARLDDLAIVEPITTNQGKAFDAWEEGNNLVLAGCAGTGKTYLAMYLALEQVLDPNTPYNELVLIRSMVPTRDMGFLPGTKQEKEDAYTAPYMAICNQLLGANSYTKAVTQRKIRFESTSFIRGLTIDNAIVVLDEMQNCNFHELDSVITRVGEDTKIILCGDYRQSDFRFEDEKAGLSKFIAIAEQLKKFDVITFDWEDIVRSGLVRDYLMTKEMLGF
tara:strand:- start:18220 stop:18942 length:723 start_codon:yes stop_codon:yes gene_type:complete